MSASYCKAAAHKGRPGSGFDGSRVGARDDVDVPSASRCRAYGRFHALSTVTPTPCPRHPRFLPGLRAEKRNPVNRQTAPYSGFRVGTECPRITSAGWLARHDLMENATCQVADVQLSFADDSAYHLAVGLRHTVCVDGREVYLCGFQAFVPQSFAHYRQAEAHVAHHAGPGVTGDVGG